MKRKKITSTRSQEKETQKNPYPGKDYEKKYERINWKSTEARRRRESGGRPESEGSTRQRNIRIKDAEEEGSPSRSERASGGDYALHGVHRSQEIWRLR